MTTISGHLDPRSDLISLDPDGRFLVLDKNGSEDPTPTNILNAGLEQFAENGYHATTTRQISSKVAMSPAVVYARFRNKSDLLFTIVRVAHVSAHAAVVDSLAGREGPVARVSSMISDFSNWHRRNNRLALVAERELLALEIDQFRTVGEQRQRTIDVFRNEINAGIEAGVFGIEPAEVEDLIVVLIGMCKDVARWTVAAPSRASAHIGPYHARLCMRLLHCDDSASPGEDS